MSHRLSDERIQLLRETENNIRNQPWLLFTLAFDHAFFFTRRLHPGVEEFERVYSDFDELITFYQQQETDNWDEDTSFDNAKIDLYFKGYRAIIRDNGDVQFIKIPVPTVTFKEYSTTAACA